MLCSCWPGLLKLSCKDQCYSCECPIDDPVPSRISFRGGLHFPRVSINAVSDIETTETTDAPSYLAGLAARASLATAASRKQKSEGTALHQKQDKRAPSTEPGGVRRHDSRGENGSVSLLDSAICPHREPALLPICAPRDCTQGCVLVARSAPHFAR